MASNSPVSGEIRISLLALRAYPLNCCISRQSPLGQLAIGRNDNEWPGSPNTKIAAELIETASPLPTRRSNFAYLRNVRKLPSKDRPDSRVLIQIGLGKEDNFPSAAKNSDALTQFLHGAAGGEGDIDSKDSAGIQDGSVYPSGSLKCESAVREALEFKRIQPIGGHGQSCCNAAAIARHTHCPAALGRGDKAETNTPGPGRDGIGSHRDRFARAQLAVHLI